MKLNKGLILAAATMTVVGGSVLGIGAYTMRQDADSDEVAALDTTSTTEEASTSTNADLGTEQYRGGGGHAGGGHFGGGHAVGHGFGGRGWGGHGGHGWAGRGWGVAAGAAGAGAAAAGGTRTATDRGYGRDAGPPRGISPTEMAEPRRA